MIKIFGAIVFHFADGCLWLLFGLFGLLNPMFAKYISNGSNDHQKNKDYCGNDYGYHVLAIGVIVMAETALS